MKIEVITPEKIIFSGEASDVVIEGYEGQLNLLDRHADIISFTRAGELSLKTATSKNSFEISSGVMKIENSKLSILSSDAKEIVTH